MRTTAYISFGVMAAAMVAPRMVFAALKLPYRAGESFAVTQGYNSPPTHIKKDLYAIDFSQDGCEAYGKPVVAAAAGAVVLVEISDSHVGYGTQVIVGHGGDQVARYAHMKPDSVAVAVGDVVSQGDVIGRVGDTGLVRGAACPAHHGTHLHFALYAGDSDGKYRAVVSEPISGYTDITEGKWYRSDNAGDAARAADAPTTDVASDAGETAAVSPPPGADMPAQDVRTVGVVAGASASSVAGVFSAMPPEVVATSVSPSPVPSGGGVSVTFDSPAAPVGESSGGSSDLTVALHESSTTQIDASSAPTSSPALGPPLPLANATSIATFDSSTFATNLSWQAPANASGTVTYSVFDLGTASSVASGSAPLWVGTSTAFSAMSSPDGTERRFGVQATDADGNASTIAVASVQTPNWLATVQPYDGNTSFPSWYSDTWYDLGTGFYGTVRSLTLNGAINNPWYFKSHLWLAEFLDPDYTTPGRSWGISDDAPFTATSTLVTMGGLDIPLQPNKYYRLYTYQDYQNRSVVLRGTVATGTAMSNGYVYGTGRVENHYAFYPYLAWTFVPNWPPLLPPDPPPGASVSFDAANLLLNLSWNPTTDPDTASTLLAYQWNVSTSTSFDDAAWQSAGKNLSAQIPLAFPNDYMIGIRAVDDLGDVSAPSVLHWSFPAGYFPLPSQLGHDDGAGAPTEFHLAGPISLSAIGLWTSANIWGWYRASYSMVSLYADASGTPGAFIASAAAMAQDLPPGSEVWHQFDNPIVLSPGDYWITGGWAGGFSNSPNIYGLNGQLYFRLQATYINE